jgi:hypothetical protein
VYDSGYGDEGEAITLVVMLFVFAIAIALAVGLHWLLYRAYQSIPAEHRQLEPGQVWLNLIPCFNFYWSFVVYVRLARSFRSYFLERHGHDPTGSFENLGLAYCVLALVSAIPYIGGCFALFSLGVLIAYLVKAWDLKRLVEADTMGAPRTF